MDVRIGVLNNIVWRHDFETRKQILDETLITNNKYNTNKLYNINDNDINEIDEEEEDE